MSAPPPAPAAPSGRQRTPRRALHGVLLLDKPLGWTSNDALVKSRGIMGALKAGHTGTLDPLATGLLPLCFGAATKFAQAALDADKHYRATLALGRTTTTGDLEGEVLQQRAVQLSQEQVEAACAALLGPQDQVPPMHSALKHEGRALYEYARAGVEVPRPPRRIHIHALQLVHWQGDELVVDVHCSKGTYVRTLAEDLGERLGCGAHLRALQRTGSGGLQLAGAIGIDPLQALTLEQRDARLLRPDVLLSHWPSVTLGADDAARFLCGLRRRLTSPDLPAVRVYGPPPGEPTTTGAAAFLGSGRVLAGELIAERLLSPPEVATMYRLPGVDAL